MYDFMRLIISAIALMLTACATSTQPSPTVSPLTVAMCPALTPLADDTFGATARKLVEVAQTYYRCRAAALANYQPDDKGR